jgi:hypothetical protein
MANTHLHAHLQPHLYANGNNFRFNIDQAYALDQELSIQEQIQAAQLLSPTEHHRQDSLFGVSPSMTPKAGVSPQQHQAVPQPYVSAAQPTSHSFAHFPANMQRSYSTTSGQYQHQVRPHRHSYDNAFKPKSVDMSRSSTQQSGRAIGNHYQADPQPCESRATSAHSYSSSVTAQVSNTFEPYDWSFKGTYDLPSAGDLEEISVGLNAVGHMFGQETTPSK